MKRAVSDDEGAVACGQARLQSVADDAAAVAARWALVGAISLGLATASRASCC